MSTQVNVMFIHHVRGYDTVMLTDTTIATALLTYNDLKLQVRINYLLSFYNFVVNDAFRSVAAYRRVSTKILSLRTALIIDDRVYFTS